MQTRKFYQKVKEKRNNWINFNYFDFLQLNESGTYNNFINYKFNSPFSFLGGYDYYQECLYESLSYSYDPNIFISKLYQLDNVRHIQFLEDAYGLIPDAIYVYCYNETSEKRIEKLCHFLDILLQIYIMKILQYVILLNHYIRINVLFQIKTNNQN